MLQSPPPPSSRDIVCFANDWAGDPLSKKHVMRRLAEKHRVLWVDSLGNRVPRMSRQDARRILAKLERFTRGLKQVERNIWVLSPLALPIYDSRLASGINAVVLGATVRAAMAWLGFRRVINYTFVPASAWVAGRLGEERVVYHCVDEYASFAGAGAQIAALEERLLKRADLVITCSQPLCERKRAINPRTILVRHGVDHAHFARALDDETPIPADLAALPRPIIGFHGLVAEWIDLRLLHRVAVAYPHASVAVVGEVRVPLGALEGLPNVHFLGRRPYETLPGYCRGFDVALLPFAIDDLTVHANPLKLREYLSAGLPVVATDIPEARTLEPLVRVASDDAEFVRIVGEQLASPLTPEQRRGRSAAMESESWDARVEEIAGHLSTL
ncbi:MAG TPA: glycosyltransferase [Polyangia bacterium]|jgi:glycosyltransferase involved in cell wall biosynthesis|nr:glycosyltransferase [Polyangia bacterium]